MERKNSRLHARTRQRQKLSRRTIIIIAASCMTCLVIGLTIFFNVSHVDQTLATQHSPVKIFMVEDQNYVDDMTLPEPVIIEHPEVNEKTQLIRIAKEIKKNQTSLIKK